LTPGAAPGVQPTAPGRTRTFRVARAEGPGGTHHRTYEVPEGPRMTVLDGLLHIQRHLDRSLAFRYNCRAMMCGSCGVRVNGVERLACSTRLSAVPQAVVTVEPLRNLPVVVDLVVAFEPFFEAWRAVQPGFIPPTERQAAAGPARIAPDAPERRAIDAHRECISCGICYSACDVVAVSPGFLGPAAITRAFCAVHDSRDAGREARLDALDRERGCWRCHTHGACAELCPKGLNPVEAIAGMKRMLAQRAIVRALRPGRS
jgi:fumarate reductase iron-sulfur subunit